MSEKSIQGLWEQLPVPSLRVSGQGAVLQANSAAEQFFNLSQKSLQGPKGQYLLGHDPSILRVLSGLTDLSRPTTVYGVDMLREGRGPISCDVNIAPLVRETGALIVFHPRDLNDRLGKNGPARSAARTAIGMAEMLAHEIKNPLAGIAGAAQLLSMGLSAEDRELTDLIVGETQRIVKLLAQVEEFGDHSGPNLKPTNIHDILDRARKSAALGFAEHMEIKDNFDPSLPLVMGDTDQLVQVIQNLMKNAAQASPHGGTITLRTFYEHSLRLRVGGKTGMSLPIQIEICDDGKGIPEDLVEQIFEPFVSGRENGTGLGLALVSKIVSEHSGWISLTSKPGQTCFRISLPVAS